MRRVEETNADEEAVKCAGWKRKLFAFEKKGHTSTQTDRQADTQHVKWCTAQYSNPRNTTLVQESTKKSSEKVQMEWNSTVIKRKKANRRKTRDSANEHMKCLRPNTEILYEMRVESYNNCDSPISVAIVSAHVFRISNMNRAQKFLSMKNVMCYFGKPDYLHQRHSIWESL